MDRWKQRNSLNLDTRAGLHYLGKIFGAGSNSVVTKDSNFSKDVSLNGNNKNRHYAGLQPLSPCWELSDSFSHSKPTSKGTKEEADQVAKLRTKVPGANTPKRPFSISGPIMRSHYANYSILSPSQSRTNESFIPPFVQLRKKQNHLQNRCNIYQWFTEYMLTVYYTNVKTH